MQTLDPPLVSALAALTAAVLMVYAGVGKRLLSWRPEPSGGSSRESGAARSEVDEMQPLVARASAAPPQSAVRLAWLVAAAAAVAAVVVAAVAADSVGLHTLFSVLGGNALANVALLTPGGVVVNQAFLVASLREATSAATESAYSVAHQLPSTVWNIVLAAVLVVAAFGRSQGKRLVEESSARAGKLRPQCDDAVLRGGASS